MKISMALAWATVLCVLLTALRYPARVSKQPRCSRAFHKLHIPVGLAALLLALLHGLLAGNFPGGELYLGPLLLMPNWGSACLLLILLLAVSWLLRKWLKKAWMPLHRVLTVLLLLALVLHLFDVGVHILDAPETASLSPSATSSPSTQPSPTSSPSTSSPSTQPSPPASQEDGSGEAAGEDPVEDPVADPTEDLLGTAQAKFSGAVLADGTYQGSGQGFNGTLTVEVTVEQGQVTAITVVSSNDTPNFFSRARAVLDSVLQSQSLEVDAVSGATYSSAGLLSAIEDALSGAVTDGELQVNESLQNLPAQGGHGHGGFGPR